MDNESPITGFDRTAGAMTCTVRVNGFEALAVIDSGSGLSVVSRALVDRCHVKPQAYRGPLIATVNGETFRPRKGQGGRSSCG